jgi:myo-inositol 2-dehydrogenase/D-chiro-inositol 1-dehydrogenase
MVEKNRVAVIGCGAVAETIHVPLLRYIPNTEIAYLVDKILSRALHLKERFSLDYAKTTTDIEEILSDDSVQSVLVLTPPSTHYKLVVKSAEAGKHIFCEKPISNSIEEAKKMVEVVNREKVILSIGFNLRYDPHLTKMKTLLDNRKFGNPWGFTSHFLGDVQRWPTVTKFQYKKGEGGALFDSGMHLIDYARWMFGEVESVKAELNTFTKGLQVEDTAYISLKMKNKVNGSLFISWHGPSHQAFEIIGSQGIGYTILQEDYISVKRFKWVALSPVTIRVRNQLPSYVIELKGFIDETTGRKRVCSVPGETGLEALRVTKAAYKSAQEKCEIFMKNFE